MDEHVGPSEGVPLIEILVVGATQVDYNILVHLRILPMKLRIYDAIILTKEMRESLIKVLLDPKIYLM